MRDIYRITIGLPKPEKDIAPGDFNAMRRAMMAGARDSALINNVLRQADYAGLNGEDRYSLLAYHALLMAEEYAQRMLLNLENLLPRAPFVMQEAGDCRRELADEGRNSAATQEGQPK